jgi:hypothetical protein
MGGGKFLLFVILNLIQDPDPQRRDSCLNVARLDADFHQHDELERIGLKSAERARPASQRVYRR